MQILSAYLLAKDSKSGFGENLFTDSQLDMSNWNIEDAVTVSYVNGVNTISFDNSGGGSGGDFYTALKDDLYARYGVTFNDNALQNIKHDWDSGSNVAFARPLSGSRAQFWIGTSGSDSPSAIVLNPPGYIIYQDNNINTFNNQILSDYASYPTQHYYGTYADYIGTLVTFEGKIWITVNVTSGKRYDFMFDECSPTGFNYKSGTPNCISITSGSTIETLVLDNASSSTMQSYRLSFVAGSSTATIMFDLSDMTYTSAVNINIKNLALYEVG